MEVPIREMKNRLSKYLRLVQAGKEVVITDRGRPVARLTVVSLTPEQAKAAYLRRIRALPWVRPARAGKVAGARRPVRLKRGARSAAQMVLEDRI
ncbi:MAG: type II toxin-antitoxin system prevent-host-death family antitoxin [Burkholderiales bacterium]|nr:type II toxin-antitoxin system prevent-host-death family antitoxin [Burkholderiales bacterium]MDW8469231.1 type II toxin-antitoxin system prevent-host-death family antitoxin [Burkholderiales bacterium]